MPVGGAKLRVVAKAKGKAGAFEVADELDMPFLPSGPKERVVQKINCDPASSISRPSRAQELDADERADDVLADVEPVRRVVRSPEVSDPLSRTAASSRRRRRRGRCCTSAQHRRAGRSAARAAQDRRHGARRHQPRVVDGDAVGRLRLLARRDRAVEWGTAYATHMLLDAKKAGYAVPDDRLQSVLAWIDARAPSARAASRPAGTSTTTTSKPRRTSTTCSRSPARARRRASSS